MFVFQSVSLLGSVLFCSSLSVVSLQQGNRDSRQLAAVESAQIRATCKQTNKETNNNKKGNAKETNKQTYTKNR